MAIQINTPSPRSQSAQGAHSASGVQSAPSLKSDPSVLAGASAALEHLASGLPQVQAQSATLLGQGEGTTSQTLAMIQQHFDPLREFLQAARTPGAPADQWQLPFTLENPSTAQSTPLAQIATEDPIAAWNEAGANLASTLEPEFADVHATKEQLQDSLRMLSASEWSQEAVSKKLDQLQPGLSQLVASPQVQQVIQQKLVPLVARMSSDSASGQRMRGAPGGAALFDIHGKLGSATSPTETRALREAMKAVGSALSMPDLGSMDVESAVQMVMMLIAKDAEEDLKIKTNEMKVKLREKKMMRTEIQLRKAERAHINESIRREFDLCLKNGFIRPDVSFAEFQAAYPFGINEAKRNNETGEVTLVYGGLEGSWSQDTSLIPESLLAIPAAIPPEGGDQVEGPSEATDLPPEQSLLSGPVEPAPASFAAAQEFSARFGIDPNSFTELYAWFKSENPLVANDDKKATQEFSKFLQKLGVSEGSDAGTIADNKSKILAKLAEEKQETAKPIEEKNGAALEASLTQLLATASETLDSAGVDALVKKFGSELLGLTLLGVGTHAKKITDLIAQIGGKLQGFAADPTKTDAIAKLLGSIPTAHAHNGEVSDKLMSLFTVVAGWPKKSELKESEANDPNALAAYYGIEPAAMEKLSAWFDKIGCYVFEGDFGTFLSRHAKLAQAGDPNGAMINSSKLSKLMNSVKNGDVGKKFQEDNGAIVEKKLHAALDMLAHPEKLTQANYDTIQTLAKQAKDLAIRFGGGSHNPAIIKLFEQLATTMGKINDPKATEWIKHNLFTAAPPEMKYLTNIHLEGVAPLETSAYSVSLSADEIAQQWGLPKAAVVEAQQLWKKNGSSGDMENWLSDMLSNKKPGKTNAETLLWGFSSGSGDTTALKKALTTSDTPAPNTHFTSAPQEQKSVDAARIAKIYGLSEEGGVNVLAKWFEQVGQYAFGGDFSSFLKDTVGIKPNGQDNAQTIADFMRAVSGEKESSALREKLGVTARGMLDGALTKLKSGKLSEEDYAALAKSLAAIQTLCNQVGIGSQDAAVEAKYKEVLTLLSKDSSPASKRFVANNEGLMSVPKSGVARSPVPTSLTEAAAFRSTAPQTPPESSASRAPAPSSSGEILGVDSYPTSQRMTAAGLDSMIDNLQSNADSMNEMDELDQIALDQAVKRRAKSFEMLSNLMKKFSDTQQSIIKNMT